MIEDTRKKLEEAEKNYLKKKQEFNLTGDHVQIEDSQSKGNFKYAYVTFTKVDDAKLVLDKFGLNITYLRLLRCSCKVFGCCLCCCKSIREDLELEEKLMFDRNGRFPKVKAAPEPDSILWHNLQFTGKQRFLRSLVTMLVSVAILAFTIYGTIQFKFQLKQFEKYKKDFACPTEVLKSTAFDEH